MQQCSKTEEKYYHCQMQVLHLPAFDNDNISLPFCSNAYFRFVVGHTIYEASMWCLIEERRSSLQRFQPFLKENKGKPFMKQQSTISNQPFIKPGWLLGTDKTCCSFISIVNFPNFNRSWMICDDTLLYVHCTMCSLSS